ncbi:MAG: inorganic pyrophosphatase [Ignavibacteria bacterium GWF2_33_9]|nr:MAG: inorganic pyrophosphatase [Ignavibacteria bacterium GWF2_33_9]
MSKINEVWDLASLRYTSHPWHGISIGEKAPDIVTCFIELIPSDTVKYELDKYSGYLKVDRPQKFSSLVPALYGFIPQTYCNERIGEFCEKQTGRNEIVGDGDPLDVLVLSERNINHGNILVHAIPIGGFRMIDGGEADDKIIAILQQDEVYKDWKDVSDLPESLINRLKHYFLTYKDMPGAEMSRCEITHTYGAEEAKEVIRLSQQDYLDNFGNIHSKLSRAAWDAINRIKK